MLAPAESQSRQPTSVEAKAGARVTQCAVGGVVCPCLVGLAVACVYGHFGASVGACERTENRKNENRPG